jgi:hypothetical protein
MKQEEILQLADRVNYLAVISYLKNTGWQRVKSPREDMAIFILPFKNELLEVLLPLDRNFADYGRSILRALEVISFIENKEVYQTLSDILLPPSDVVRYRIVNRDTEDGTITFDDGFNLLENARMSLYTSACDILQPAFYHKRLSLKNADQFIKQCRLGQTERGSFIASIICPFTEQVEGIEVNQLTLFSTPEKFTSSFTRRVTSNLLLSVQKVKRAIENDTVDELLNPDRTDKISANFLQSLVSLSEIENQPKTDLEIIATWSAVAPTTDLPASVSLSQEYIPAIRGIIQKVLPKDEKDPGEFIGKISQVRAEPDVNKREEGEITFNFMSDNYKTARAKVTLNPEDYKRACEAHEHGLAVRIRGVLVTTDRTKIIQEPVFEILDRNS